MLQRGKVIDKSPADRHSQPDGNRVGSKNVSSGRPLVLVSPNISEQMGGEAIKAHQFLRHLIDQGRDVTVVTHRRSAPVLKRDFPQVPVFVVEDTPGQKLVWHLAPLRPLVDIFFFAYARAILRRFLATHPGAIVHYLCPVSPILPRFPLPEAINVLGPLTGNIYYPPGFRRDEPVKLKLGRLLHYLMQRTAGAVFGDKPRFDRILVSGGERTCRSLMWAGVRREAISEVTDAGIADQLVQRDVIVHEGANPRFMTSSRLVAYKGVQLTIAALRFVPDEVRFDVYGSGAYRASLEALVEQLDVAHKVRFMGWTQHDDLVRRMHEYRGFVAPSLAEANGISVQEAMTAGLPVICLKWGGPELLADEGSAVMIEPSTPDGVVREIAEAMTLLARDPDRANAIAARARGIAERRFSWDDVASEWQASYGLA